MAYYSEVCLVLSSNAVSLFNKRYEEVVAKNHSNSDINSENSAKNISRFIGKTDHYKYDSATDTVLLYWNSVKWYSEYGYPEIDFFVDLMKSLSFREYLFIRVGEAFDDVEIDGNFWKNPFGIEVKREIKIA